MGGGGQSCKSPVKFLLLMSLVESQLVLNGNLVHFVQCTMPCSPQQVVLLIRV